MKTMPRWLQTILASMMLFSLAGGAWLYRKQEQQIRAHVEGELSAVAAIKTSQIAEWRKNQLNRADDLMTSAFLVEGIAQWLANPKTDPEKILTRFRSYQSHYNYHDILLTDPAGHVRLNLSGTTGAEHVEIMPDLNTAIRERKSILTDLHTCNIDSAPHISVIAPIFSDNGDSKSDPRPLGAIILVNDSRQYLNPLIQSWPTLSKTAETLLVRKDGDHVLFLNDLRHQRDTALKLRIPLSRTEVPAVMAVLGRKGVVNGQDYRGIRVVSSIQPIPDSPWFIVAKMDATEAFAEWRFRAIAIVGLILAMMVLEGTAVVLVWQRNEKAHFRSLYQSETARRAGEERFRVVAESLSDVIYEWDLAERIEWFGNIDALMGFGPGEFPRTLAGWAALIHPEDRNRVRGEIDRHLKGIAPYNVDYQIRKKDGTYACWTARGKITCDSDGKAFKWIGAITDITERKKVENALVASQKDLSLRNDLSQVFLTASNEEMYAEVLSIILKAMHSPHGSLGYLDEEGSLVVPSMMRHMWDKCHVQDKSILFPRSTWGNGSWPQAILEKKGNYSNSISQSIPGGHIEARRQINMPILFQGEVIGLIQIANKEMDYSHDEFQLLEVIGSIIAPVLDARLKRDRQEAARQRALADLERSNIELEQFAHVVSHDLQEPLRTVSSFTQLLARRYERQLDDEAHEFIRYAVEGTQRMQQLIKDLLSYARVTTRGNLFVPVDLSEAMGAAIANLQSSIRESSAVMTSDELPSVKGDYGQLVQVFQNLIGNAIKFRKNDQTPRVHISAEKTGLEWIISVKDNGIGIDPQYFNRLFTIFQRLHGRQEYPGTGIGLAICQRIVTRHGGRIWVESALGEGATFHFSFVA